MTKITPEERAANETEAQWKARANGKLLSFGCGWCNFAKSFGIGDACYVCPIYRLTEQSCTKLPVYEKYCNAMLGSQCREIAMEIYELLVKNRRRLLDAAREILSEIEQ